MSLSIRFRFLAATAISLLPFLCQGQAIVRSDTLFFDDFNGPALDRTKWNVEVNAHPPNQEQEAYVDSNATVYISHGREARGASGGVLVIRPLFIPGLTHPAGRITGLISGRINTRNKVEFIYGKASARMKLPAGQGFWPAFWILGNGHWPETGEIDVMENIGDPGWVSSAMHGPGYHGNTPLVRRDSFQLGEDITQWHVYQVDWTPDSLVFSVDGRPFYTVTKTMVTHYGPWAFSNQKYLILNLALGGGYPKTEDQVVSPYFGLTQNAFQKIKRRQAKVLIDWVLVTRREE
ncbi:MAG TPA: glycoside hydrolase family 16 protein [Chitinophagaceae bacterium]|nr:glycoside hydrolase family 16 protein [Chitinophagaceae bacterium]